MRKFIYIILVISSAFSCACNSKEDDTDKPNIDTIKIDASYNIDIKDFLMRDPFVFVDTIGKSYYIQASSGDNQTLKVYQSKDLKKWKNLGKSFIAPSDFWGKQDFWAPDMFQYKGKYYISATFSATGIKRGCSFLVSDFPQGPYEPLTNKLITPAGWTCLDGTLYIDNGQPYLLFCREWLEVIDGRVYLQKLSNDLKTTVGDPILLFNASSAPWVGDISAQDVTGKVTDAPFIYRISNTELIMFWSSFAKNTGKYSIGVARSTTGLVTGPWVQDLTPLNNDDGGHAMVFKTLDGKLKISYHSPNTYPNYVSIYDLDIYEGEITIIK